MLNAILNYIGLKYTSDPDFIIASEISYKSCSKKQGFVLTEFQQVKPFGHTGTMAEGINALMFI